MKYFIILLLLTSGFQLNAQGLRLCPLDSSYVWANNGLSLRETQNGERIEILPFGTQVKVLHQEFNQNQQLTKGQLDSIQIMPPSNCHGHKNAAAIVKHKWYYVQAGETRGWVFGLYLSRIRPPNVYDSSDYYLFDKFITNNFDTLLSNEQDPDNLNTLVYTNGVIQTIRYHEGGGRKTYVIPGNLNISDRFSLINYFKKVLESENSEHYTCLTVTSNSTLFNTYRITIEMDYVEGVWGSIEINYVNDILTIIFDSAC